MDEITRQTLNQKKIALAQSEYAPIIIELMKDVMKKNPIVGETEWATIVNAISLDTSTTMITDMVDWLEKIRQGELNHG